MDEEKQKIVEALDWASDHLEVSSMSESEIVELVYTYLDGQPLILEGKVLDTIVEWREARAGTGQVVVVDDVMVKYFALKRQADTIDAEINVYRQKIFAYVEKNGAVKNATGTATIAKPSKRVSYDASAVDSLLATLVRAGLSDYAMQLESARKESTPSPYVLIKASKE